MAQNKIFGYGSLLSTASLQKTVPSPKALTPCYIQGFRRNFSFQREHREGITHFDASGPQFAALNVLPHTDPAAHVNGVLFDLSDEELAQLMEREHGYDMLETTTYDFVTHEPLGTCIVFSANQEQEAFNYDAPGQLRYLQICLDGAREHGDTFYQTFITSTYVNGIPLHEALQRLSGQPELSLSLAS